MKEWEQRIENIERRLENIEKRNKRVEIDKKWETSFLRKICIAILTVVVVVIYSWVIKRFDNIIFNSLVPVIGFILSTLSIKFIRKLWEKRQ